MVFYIWLSKNHVKNKETLQSNEASFCGLLTFSGPGPEPGVREGLSGGKPTAQGQGLDPRARAWAKKIVFI